MRQQPIGSATLVRSSMAYVLAGGRGTRLQELTAIRAKPAVYFGGKSRIIDFSLSNALNSGIRRIGVATQYKAHSLIRHMQRGWNFFRPERNESFDILPASQRVRATTGMPAPPTRSTRTSTSSNPTRRNTSSCWQATTSTKWTTRSMLAAARRERRRRHGRLHRGAAAGGARLRRHGG